MSEVRELRRAVARLPAEARGGSIVRVGEHPVHRYWSLIQTHLRLVLLPPQWQTDTEDAVWTWTEVVGAPAPTAAELSALRNRLRDGVAALMSSPVASGTVAGLAGSARAEQISREAALAARDIIHGLLAKTDQELSQYVARTSQGLLLHSWGSAVPAVPQYAPTEGLSVSGRVVVLGPGEAAQDIVLEDEGGDTVARTRSNDQGNFKLTGALPGRYRVRGISGDMEFAAAGVAVQLENRSIEGLQLKCQLASGGMRRAEPKSLVPAAALKSSAASRPAGGAAPAAGGSAIEARYVFSKPRTGHRWVAALAGLLVLGGSVWVTQRWLAVRSPAVAVIDAGPPGDDPTKVAERPSRSTAEPVQPTSAPTPTLAPAVVSEAPRPSPEASPSPSPAPLLAGPASTESTPAPAIASSSNSKIEAVPTTREAQTVPSSSSTFASRKAALGRPDSGGPPTTPGAAASAPVGLGDTGSPPAPSTSASGASSSEASRLSSSEAASASPVALANSASSPPVAPLSVSAEPEVAGPTPAAAPFSQADAAFAPHSSESERTPPATPSPRPSPATPIGSSSEEASLNLTPVVSAQATKSEAAPAASRPTEAAVTSQENSVSDVHTVSSAQTVRTLPTEVPGAEDAGARSGAVPSPEISWEKVRVSSGPWRMVLTRDTIVDTRPVAVTRRNDADARRQALLAERDKSKPAELEKAQTWVGFSLKLPHRGTSLAGLRWNAETGDAGEVVTTFREGRAEIAWRGVAPRGLTLVLEADEGGPLARLSFDAVGKAEWAVVAGTPSWLWLGAEFPADLRPRKTPSTATGAKSTGDRWQWKTPALGGLSVGWVQDERWLKSRGRRIELSLTGPDHHGLPPRFLHELLLTDAETDWSLATSLERY